MGSSRSGGLQGAQQSTGVLAHPPHGTVREQLGEALGHRPTVGEHVADTAGGAHVVLEHPEAAGAVAHQVDAGDVDAHAVGRTVALHRVHDVGGGVQQGLGDHAVGHGPAFGVHVVQERLQGAHPLRDADGDQRPLLGRDHPGDGVHRERTLLAGVVEGDTLVEVAGGKGLRAGAELLQPQAGEGLVEEAVGGAHPAVGGEHLVAGTGDAVLLEQRAA